MITMLIAIIVLTCCLCSESKKFHELEKENKMLKQELSKYVPNQNFYTNPQNMQQGNINYVQQPNMNYQQQPNNMGYQQSNNMGQNLGYQQQNNMSYVQQPNMNYQQQPNNMGYVQQYNMNQNMAYQSQPYNMQQKKVLTKEEMEKAKRESRNVGILVTGSIFIVLSAIVFLASTWSILSDIVKTVVIFLLIGVFGGASLIAKNKFKLPKASKAFFYLAMAYIPIALIACSIFGLFGEYLSINGEGRYIYLTGVTTLLAIIYLIYYKTRHENILLCGSILSQISTIVFGNLIFNSEPLVLCIILLIYSCLLTLISNALKTSKTLYIFSNIIIFSISIILIPLLFVREELLLILLPLLALNFLLLKKNNSKLYSCYTNMVIYVFGIHLSLVYLNIENDIKLVLSLIYLVCIFVLLEIISNATKDNDIRKSSIPINASLVLLLAFVSAISKAEIMKPFIFFGIETVLLMIAYIRNNKNAKGSNIYGYLAPCTFILTAIQILDSLKADFYFYIILALVFLKISDLKMPKQFTSLKKGIFFISQCFITILYLMAPIKSGNELINLIIGLIVTAYLIFDNFKQKQNQYLRIIPAIGFLIVLMNSAYNGNEIYSKIIISVSTVALTAISIYKRKLSIDTTFSTIYALATIILFEDIFVKEGIFIIWSLINLLFMNEQKVKDLFKTLLFTGIFLLYNSILGRVNIQYYSLRAIGFTLLALAILKNVIKNYSKNSQDTIEYIILFLIFAFSLGVNQNIIDGMIFELFLVIVLILSYIKKYGAVFIATLVAIIVNAFILTREFWFSIPWWIYLLVVGGLLIAFAIKNESDEKKGKKKITGAIKDLKDKIEK